MILLSLAWSSICLAQDVEPAVAAGGSHSVLLLRDGTVWCWGANAYGQLGNGTMDGSMTPVRVEELTGVKGVAAGDNHTVALKDDGTVWTWGRNDQGQLGNNSASGSQVPVKVGVAGDWFTGVTSIAAGADHTVALKSDGTVWAWGYNLQGQLGDGTETGRRTPVQVQGLAATVIAIAAGGYHTVALLEDGGSVWSWGNNTKGQLGDGTTAKRVLPVRVVASAGSDEPLQNVQKVAAGNMHTLALDTDNEVWTWGNNDCRQLGDMTTATRITPILISSFDSVIAVACGGNHSLAVKDNQTAWAWGHNNNGQLGNMNNDNQGFPRQVRDGVGNGHITNISAIAGGTMHTLAMQSDGTAWAWGYNNSGQLGDGTQSSINIPVQVLLPAPPEVLSKTPGDGGTDVTTGAAVEVVFSEDMREGITYDAVTIRDNGENPIAVNINITGSVLRLEPVAALDYNAVYTVIIPRWAVQGMPGNLLAADLSYSFTTETGPDTTPPVINLFTLNGGAAQTNSRAVRLQIEATDDITSQANLRLCFSNDNVSWSDWEAYATEKDWTLADGDGEKAVYIQVKDEAGNVAATQAGIILAVTAPEPDPDPWTEPYNTHHSNPSPDPLPLAETEASNPEELKNSFAPSSLGILASAADVYAFPVSGVVIDNHLVVLVDAAILWEAVEQTRQAGKENLALVVIGGEEVGQIQIIIPAESLELLVTAGFNLFVCMPKVELGIQSVTLTSIEQEQGMDITVAVVNEQGAQFSLVEQEGDDLLLQNNLFGEPLHITSSFDGRTRVVFPLPENPMSFLQAERLSIYVEHSDGERVMLEGELYYDALGAVVGIGGWVDRFSIFALLEPKYKKALYMKPGCDQVMVNGEQTVLLDVPPFIDGDSASLMVPVRFLGEIFGGRVSFLPQEKKITIDRNNQEISLVVGCDKLLVDGKETVLPCPVSVVEGRAFAPLRLISEVFGADVVWDGEERKVTITKGW